jgi:hypothetical protein
MGMGGDGCGWGGLQFTVFGFQFLVYSLMVSVFGDDKARSKSRSGASDIARLSN